MDLSAVSRSRIFKGLSEEESIRVISDLDPRIRRFRRGEFIIMAGDIVQNVGIVMEGSVSVCRDDYWGNRNIVGRIGPGDTFAESYALAGGRTIDVSVQAAADCQVCSLSAEAMLSEPKLTRSLLNLLANKNLYLNNKLTHVTQRSTREKLLSYLSQVAQQERSSDFVIPFNRQELADYLAVDRSAMSSELGRMRDEGILDFHRAHFVLHDIK